MAFSIILVPFEILLTPEKRSEPPTNIVTLVFLIFNIKIHILLAMNGGSISNFRCSYFSDRWGHQSEGRLQAGETPACENLKCVEFNEILILEKYLCTKSETSHNVY